MKPLILALLLLIPISAASQESHLVRIYDRFEDRTRYWIVPVVVKQGLDLTVNFSFKGKGAGHPIDVFGLVFSSSASDWRYLKDSQLYCLLDGERFDLGSARYADNDVHKNYGTVEVKETLAFPVRYSFLQKMAKAKRIEMRLGDTEFFLYSEFKDSLKELLNKVQVVK